MSEIDELKKKLLEAERNEYIQKKTEWHEKTVEFLNTIVNKTLAFEYRNSKWSIFRVTGWNRRSWYAQPEIEDFYEIMSKGYFELYNHEFLTKITPNCNEINLVKVKSRKGKQTLELPYLVYWEGDEFYDNHSMVESVGEKDSERVNYIGRIPPPVQNSFLTCFIVPDDLYDKLLDMKNQILKNTVELYKEYKGVLTLDRLLK